MQLNRAGVSLVELIIAVFIATTVVASLSLLLPKAAANTSQIQQRSIANQLANAEIQSIKAHSYDYTDVTNVANIGDATCDCRKVTDFSTLLSTATPAAGTTMHTASCIHLVDQATAWQSQCAGDTGYKNIVVYVYWSSGSRTYSISQESLMTHG
jgi:Tfp pilus assembly protein PilV